MKEAVFTELVLDHRKQLQVVFASDISNVEKRAAKAQIFDDLHEEYRQIKATQPAFSRYEAWFKQRPNNARLATVAIYTQLLPAFQALLEQQDGDMDQFFLVVKEISKLTQEERASVLQAAVEAAGVEILYEAPAQRLVVNPEGRVVGVVIDIDGVEEYVKASKGVALCAGGFAANKEMVAQHCPPYLQSQFLVGTKTDDGTGIRMGQGTGGDLRMMGDAFAYSGIYEFGEALVKGILVDDKGRRFIGEDNYGSWVGKELIQRHPASYVVVDQAIWDEVPEQGRAYIAEHIKFAGPADTIAELARAANINSDLLENTLGFYNEHAAKGEDPECSKDPHYLVPLEKGPFYAVNFPAAYAWFFTTGGLKTNGKAEVVDSFGDPIPGLYAAGRNAFGVSAQQYPGSGTSVGDGLTFGRIAGKNAAALEPWS